MRTVRMVLPLLVAALLGLAVGMPSASAAPPSSSSATPGLVQVATAGGGVAGWASQDYIANHPGAIGGLVVVNGHITQPSSSSSGMQLQSSPDGTVHTDSANGCNRNVCIDIEGSSGYVTQWTSTAYGNVGCTYTQFQRSGQAPVSGPQICPDGSGAGAYYDSTGPTGVFRNNQQVCNVWRNIAGRPCETIYY